MTAKTRGMIQELGGQIEKAVGANAAKKVMEGSDRAVKSTDSIKTALWVKEAIDRLDAATEPEQCREIMAACGHSCIAHNQGLANGLKNRRAKHDTEEVFLEAEIKNRPVKGIRLELKGKTLTQYYTPHVYSPLKRCLCSLVSALPEGVNMSLTYCQCSRAFVEKYWEGALGRPVKVDVIETCISGADECKFIIHL